MKFKKEELEESKFSGEENTFWGNDQKVVKFSKNKLTGKSQISKPYA